MTNLGNEIVVPWSFGFIQQIILESTWEQFSDRQKHQWMREMDSSTNMVTNVRLLRGRRLIELYFQRRLPGCGGAAAASTYIAGKWVQISDFDDLWEEAQKFFH